MNTCNLVGTLTRAPTTKFEVSGSQSTSFTLAIQEPAREGSKTFTLYVPCICWGRVADQAALLGAEDLISLTGKLCWRKTTDTKGQEKSSLAVMAREVQVLMPAELPVAACDQRPLGF